MNIPTMNPVQLAMTDTATSANKPSPQQRRSFKIHPSIIRTIIHEQAGSLEKAMAELVMNSVDAGATRIDIYMNQSARTFRVVDNGRGFQSLGEIEDFFETWGKPHDEEDTPKFGRFRIGRGQIMSYAATHWRSGNFGMDVDLQGQNLEFGYQLNVFPENQAGCTIEGKFYKHTNVPWPSTRATYWPELKLMVRYVTVPVHLHLEKDGEDIDSECITAGTSRWSDETEAAYFKFKPDQPELYVYNQGIFVTSFEGSKFGCGGVINSKLPLPVNLARNAIIENGNPVWKSIVDTYSRYFSIQITKSKTLTEVQCKKLLHDLIYSDQPISEQSTLDARQLACIPDLNGQLQPLFKFIHCSRFTVFDGKHHGIAERVIREDLAWVVTGKLLHWLGCTRDDSPEHIESVIQHLQRRMGFKHHAGSGLMEHLPFARLIRQLNDTASRLKDDQLTDVELMTLKCLRSANYSVHRMVFGWGSVERVRRIVAGVSDTADGWTDGLTYIAINRKHLQLQEGNLSSCLYYGYPATGFQFSMMVNILIHEYCHLDTSVGEHQHDFEFYQRFHSHATNSRVQLIINDMAKEYLRGMHKIGKRPGGLELRSLKQYAAVIEKFPMRSRKPRTEP